MSNIVPERILLLLYCFVSPLLCFGLSNDTIPLIISEMPSNLSINCEEPYLDALTDWYNNSAGFEAFDATSTVSYHSIYTLEEVDSLFLASSDTLCDQGLGIDVGFFAMDTCDNSTDTLFSRFETFDNRRPEIFVGAQPVSFFCDVGIVDSLNQWLDSNGGAVAVDNCSDSVIWTNYFWNDSEGNSGFVNQGEPSTIVIQRTSCEWSVNVSFFVEDPCGNTNVSNGSFTIEGDTIAPQLIVSLSDTILECSSLPYMELPIFEDGCDGMLELLLEEESTQDQDSTSCGHYQFEITRTWTAIDACGNSSSTSQVINVEDTMSPAFEFESFVLVDCDKDIINDLEEILEPEDNCSTVVVEFEDTVISDDGCISDIDRNYTVTDACGNSFNFTQAIRVQDLSPPAISSNAEDMRFSCSDDVNILQTFDLWIANNGNAIFEDNCNSVDVFALNPGTYNINDAESIQNASPALLDLDACLNGLNNEIIREELDFVFLDFCGNISVSSASFVVRDTLAPVINGCNADLDIVIGTNTCDTTVILSRPFAEDACSLFGADFLSYTVSINSEFNLDFENQEELAVGLDVGEYTLLYTVVDCAGNSSNCVQQLNIRENIAPTIICPSDRTIEVNATSCDAFLKLSEDYVVEENCLTNFSFSETQPTGEGYISFFFNQDLDTFVSNSIFLGYTDIEFQGSVSDATLELFFSGDTDSSDEFYTLFSESGQEIAILQFDDASCGNVTSTKVNLNIQDFLIWGSNGTIFFTLGANSENTDGINPCIELTENGFDNTSFLKATLRYNDDFPNYEIRNEQDEIIPLTTFADSTRLDVGTYTIQYMISDASGNVDSCSYNVDIVDFISPEVECGANDTLFVQPNLDDELNLAVSQLNITATDNCQVESIRLSPNQIDCDLFNKENSFTVTATDIYGNESSCNSTITISPVTLEPSFSSGLCIDDTLQLLANLEVNDFFTQLSYHWTGPNNFESFEPNPRLTLLNPTFSGTYNLEVIDLLGCSYSGSVNIELMALNSPEIFASDQVLCEGENLLLNSTSFVETVNYLWYEGVSPDGVLLFITNGPSVQLQPTPGTHLYYVDIEGENCNTNESSTIQVTVEETPVAQIEEPFITICEGENIVLSSNAVEPGLEYIWSGPAGYSSTGQFPDLIQNATAINEGSYSLVVSKNGCLSDTSFAQVIVFPEPARPQISGQSVFCEGSNFIISVNNIQSADQYFWFKDGLFNSSSNINNLIIPSAQSDLSGEWTVVVQDGLCFSDTSSVFSVEINAEINIGASNNGPICEGDSVTLSSSFIPDAEYIWLTPSGDLVNGRNQILPAEQGTYNLTVTTSSGCSNVTSTIVDVLEVPRITALSNSSSECMEAINLIEFFPTVFPVGNYTFDWTGPNDFTSDQQNPQIVNATELNNGTYTLVISDGNCISEPMVSELDIHIIPEIPIISQIGPTCIGEAIFIETAFVDNAEYLWSTPKGTIATNTNALLIDEAVISDNGFYSLQIQVENCASGFSDSIEIEIMSAITKPVIEGERLFCISENLSLETVAIDGATYVWMGPNGIISETSNILNIANLTEDEEGVYTVIVEIDGCQSEPSDDFAIEINPIPAPISFESISQEVCLNGSNEIELCLESIPQVGELIFLVDFQKDSIVERIDDMCFIYEIDTDNQESGSIDLSLKRSVALCLSENSTPITIEWYIQPEIGIQFDVDTLFACPETTLNTLLIGDQELIIEFESTDNNVLFQEEGLDLKISNITNEMGIVYVHSFFRSCGNFFSDSAVFVQESPIEAIDDSLSQEYNTISEINLLDNDIFQNPVQLFIIDDNGLDIEMGNDGNLMILENERFIGTATILYEICLENCPQICDRASLILEIGDSNDCFVGNVITPNNDGINDLLIVPCLNSGTFPESEILIFNQWGATIFNAAPYENDWDGTYNGEVLSSGTYYYQLKLSNNQEPLSGFIVIER